MAIFAEEARREQAIRELRATLPELARAWHAERSIGETFRELAVRHRALHREAFEWALWRLAKDGWRIPQRNVAFAILGSGARDEQSILCDQDHALLYEDGDDGDEPYFKRLGETVAALLHDVGYPLCSGNVMASNPRWRGSTSAWEARLAKYEALPDWDSIRYLLIAADARVVWGDPVLVERMRAQAVGAVARSAFIKWKTADQGLSQKVSLTLRGHLRLEPGGVHKGRFALKDSLYTPLVNSIRIWALSLGLEQPGTAERIDGLVGAHAWSTELADRVRAALSATLEARLSHHLCQDRDGEMLDDYVDPDALPECLLKEVKLAHHTLRQLQQVTARQFPKGVLRRGI